MSIGSFLAGAGNIAEGIERYQTESELRRLQREAAAAQRAQMKRAELERIQLQGARAGGAAIPDVAGLLLPAVNAPAGILPAITPPPQLEVPPAEALPTTGAGAGVTGAGLLPATPAATAPGKPAPRAPAAQGGVSMLIRGQRIPVYNSKDPNAISDDPNNTWLGAEYGFQQIDPNASDFEQRQLRQRNEDILSNRLSGVANEIDPMRGNTISTLVNAVRRDFATQSDKAALDLIQSSNNWYRSNNAREYFRRNPQMLPYAEREPVKFYSRLMRYNTAPDSGQWYFKAGATPTPAAAAAAGVTPPVVAKPAQARLQAINEAIASIPANDPFRRIIGLEGGFNTRNGTFNTSPDGAIGPAQLMPDTAPEAMELAGFARNDNRWRTDPRINIMAGRAYYNMLLQRYNGDPVKAAAAYNTGPGNMDRALAKASRSGLPWQDHLPAAETRKYVQDFVAGTGRATRFLGGEGAAPADTGASQQAGLAMAAQEPVLNLTNINTYLGDPAKVPVAVANTARQRDLLAQEARIYARSGNEAAYQQALARIQETDANLTRLVGAQAIIDINTFNNPSRAEQLLSYLSNGQLQVRMRQDGRFAFFARNQQGQYVPVPGQDNVSRTDFISTLRSASDEVYRAQRSQAEAAAAAAQAEYSRDVNLEVVKGRIEGELQTQRLGVDINKSVIEARARLAEARMKGAEVKPFTDESGTWITRTNPDNPNDPILARVVDTTLPNGEVIQTLDQRPFSQWGQSAQ